MIHVELSGDPLPVGEGIKGSSPYPLRPRGEIVGDKVKKELKTNNEQEYK